MRQAIVEGLKKRQCSKKRGERAFQLALEESASSLDEEKRSKNALSARLRVAEDALSAVEEAREDETARAERAEEVSNEEKLQKILSL